MKDAIQFSGRVILLIAVLGAIPIFASAQVRQPFPTPRPMTADKSHPDSDEQAPTALDEELRAKRAIKYAEKEHQENLSRAREASELGQAIVSAYKENQALKSNDLKKLDKLEKLTKKIRNEAGASDEEFVLENKPETFAQAVEGIGKVSSSLNEKVLKTPRRVVSTSIIEEANVLLELIRIVRNFAK